MSDDPIRWAEGGGPPGGAELVGSLRRPPPLPPDLRTLSRAPRPAPPRAPRWIGPALASAVIVGGLLLWVFRPPQAPPPGPDSIAPLATTSPTPPAPIAPAASIAPADPEPTALAPIAEAPIEDAPSSEAPSELAATDPEPTDVAPTAAEARRPRRAMADDAPHGVRETLGSPGAPPRASEGEGMLRINTRPWTQVFVDGRLIGLTPQMDIRLPAGRHLVMLVNHEARIRETIVVHIRAGETETRVLSLEPGEAQRATADGAAGYLMIQSVPWARVWLDGRDTGHNTPVRRMRVSAGRHVIRLVIGDGTRHDVSVHVPAGETVRIVRQL